MTIALLLVLLLGAGATWQLVASARDKERFPPPGTLVGVDGGTLHLNVTGPADADVTVLLEAGATGYSSQWHWIQKALSEHVRVVSYDRPGLAWSTPYDGPHDARAVVDRLREALDGEGISGPFVLVAHSYGSFIARVFAHEFDDEVVGIALLDATHPDQFGGREIGAGFFAAAPVLARVGLLRVMDPSGPATVGLPEDLRAEARAMFASPSHLAAVADEAAVWHVSARQAADAGSLGDTPLVVVSADSMTAQLPKWPDHQADLATLSTRVRHIQAGADVTHESLVMDPATATEIADLVLSLLAD